MGQGANLRLNAWSEANDETMAAARLLVWTDSTQPGARNRPDARYCDPDKETANATGTSLACFAPGVLRPSAT